MTPQASGAQALCESHQCPMCGRYDHVTVERVIIGDDAIEQCHCRACDASWPAGTPATLAER